jgi:NTP pyrophosphatase (non-canonical NTP hydrolase)
MKNMLNERMSTYSTHTLSELEAEALGILQEEAAEVIQEASKIRRSGPDFCRKGTDVGNMEHFQMEIEDFRLLLEICTYLGMYCEPSEEWKAEYRNLKLHKLRHWSKLGPVIDDLQRISQRNPA